MSDRWIPLGISSIEDSGPYEGHNIRFRQGKHGAVKASLYDGDGYIVDEIIGWNFMDAYDSVITEWPGATWHNREED